MAHENSETALWQGVRFKKENNAEGLAPFRDTSGLIQTTG